MLRIALTCSWSILLHWYLMSTNNNRHILHACWIKTIGRQVCNLCNELWYALTFKEPLKHKHLGEDVKIDKDGKHILPVYAEVGLLTHNIVFRGSQDMSWYEEIPACPDDFSPGMLLTVYGSLVTWSYAKLDSERCSSNHSCSNMLLVQ